jgi:hypothetical protein
LAAGDIGLILTRDVTKKAQIITSEDGRKTPKVSHNLHDNYPSFEERKILANLIKLRTKLG